MKSSLFSGRLLFIIKTKLDFLMDNIYKKMDSFSKLAQVTIEDLYRQMLFFAQENGFNTFSCIGSLFLS